MREGSAFPVARLSKKTRLVSLSPCRRRRGGGRGFSAPLAPPAQPTGGAPLLFPRATRHPLQPTRGALLPLRDVPSPPSAAHTGRLFPLARRFLAVQGAPNAAGGRPERRVLRLVVSRAPRNSKGLWCSRLTLPPHAPTSCCCLACPSRVFPPAASLPRPRVPHRTPACCTGCSVGPYPRVPPGVLRMCCIGRPRVPAERPALSRLPDRRTRRPTISERSGVRRMRRRRAFQRRGRCSPARVLLRLVLLRRVLLRLVLRCRRSGGERARAPPRVVSRTSRRRRRGAGRCPPSRSAAPPPTAPAARGSGVGRGLGGLELGVRGGGGAFCGSLPAQASAKGSV